MATAATRLADVNQDKVTPGVLGFLVVAVLAVATWLLIRSMNKHMRRVDFDESAVDRREPDLAGNGRAAAARQGADADAASDAHD